MKTTYTLAVSGPLLARLFKKTFLFTALLLLHQTMLKAQPIPCPPNIDFETGTFLNWGLFTGSDAGSTLTPTWTGPAAPVANRHEIRSGNGQDPYGNGSNFPVVAPGGGTYSLKLGNDGTGSQCERQGTISTSLIIKTIIVLFINTLLFYRTLVVHMVWMKNPNFK